MFAPTLITLLVASVAPQHPVAQAWEHFPVFVWAEKPGASEIVRQFGGACVRRDDEARELRELGLDYFVFNAPGRNDLHVERESKDYAARWQRWYETRDPALLVREPCLTAAATRERMAKQLEESLKARDGRQGFGVSLGDEVGLTAGGGPEDICQCADCEAAWKPFAAHRGIELALSAVTTQGALDLLREADTSALGAWLARREFHQQVLLDDLGELARRSRALSPATPVGLLGLVGRTAFGGVSIERVLPQLDFLECYEVGDAREMAFTLRRPEQRMLATMFLDARGPVFSARKAWEFWMYGGDGVVLWSEAELARQPEQRAALARAIADIRAVQKRIGRFRPEPQGVALVHSDASISAAWMRDALGDGATWPKRFASYQEEHGAFELARERWIAMLWDIGTMPGSVPLAQVDAATVARFPLLVLSTVLVVDDADMLRLKRYCAAGGRLCITGEFGWIDSQGRKPNVERIKELAALVPSPLIDARGFDPSNHSWSWSSAELSARLGVGDAATAPFSISDTSKYARTWMLDGAAVIGAALPFETIRTHGKVSEQYWPERIAIDVGDAWRIEWIYPTPGEDGVVHIAPGDAAVFRMTPKKN